MIFRRNYTLTTNRIRRLPNSSDLAVLIADRRRHVLVKGPEGRALVTHVVDERSYEVMPTKQELVAAPSDIGQNPVGTD